MDIDLRRLPCFDLLYGDLARAVTTTRCNITTCSFLRGFRLFCRLSVTGITTKSGASTVWGKMTDPDIKQNDRQSIPDEAPKPVVAVYDAWERRFKDRDKFSHSLD